MKKKIFFILIILTIVFNFGIENNVVNADVNSNYGNVSTEEPFKSDDDKSSVGNNIKRLAEDLVLDLATKFVFSVADLVERYVSKFTKFMFGVPKFPWSDLIVFNALPYLDINFFNYTDHAIYAVGNNALGNIIKNLYYTFLVLSVSLLGVGTAITAIRLAASTIASDKAKYKESITKCLYTVVVLLSLHFLLSFIFTLNEQIVESASNILTNYFSNAERERIQENMSSFAGSSFEDQFVFFYDNLERKTDTHVDNFEDFWSVLNNVNMYSIGWPSQEDKDRRTDAYDKYESAFRDHPKEAEYVARYLLSKSSYRDSRFSWDGEGETPIQYYDWGGDSQNTSLFDFDGVSIKDTSTVAWRYAIDIWNVVNASSEENLKSRYSGETGRTFYKKIKEAYTLFIAKDFSSMPDIVSVMGEQFKDLSQVDENGSLMQNGSREPVATILYAILVVQSLMLLITYLKRVFYVAILSLLGPIVVIYDFFLNSKNKIFTVWFKELCTLVFVQSLQAFLLAISFIIIMDLYLNSISNDDTGAYKAIGIYCIIILTLVPKIELLIKRIFGLGSGVMDDSMMGGKKSLLKTGIALKMGGRVLNNAGKFLGGTAGLIGSFLPNSSINKKTRIAQNNYDASRIGANRDNMLGPGGSNSDSGRNSGSSVDNRSLRARNYNINNSLDDNRNRGNLQGNFSASDLADAIKNAGKDSPEEALEKARHDAAQQRLNSLHKMASGATETLGAIGGASVGAVVGLGMGGDDILENAMIGAGVGDRLGEIAAGATLGNATRINEWQYNRRKLDKDLRKSEKKKNDAQSQYDAVVNAARQNNTQQVSRRTTSSAPKISTKNMQSIGSRMKNQNTQVKAAKEQLISDREVQKSIANSNNTHKSSQLKEINQKISQDRKDLSTANKQYNATRTKVEKAINSKPTSMSGNFRASSRGTAENSSQNRTQDVRNTNTRVTTQRSSVVHNNVSNNDSRNTTRSMNNSNNISNNNTSSIDSIDNT